MAQIASDALQFASQMAGATGLNSGVLLAWMACENNIATARNGGNDGIGGVPENWMNIGMNTSGYRGGDAQAFQTVPGGVQATVSFLHGQFSGWSLGSIDGSGILASASGSASGQLAAINSSGWVTGTPGPGSGYGQRLYSNYALYGSSAPAASSPAGGVYGAGGTGGVANQTPVSPWQVGDSQNPDQDYWTTINQYCQNAQWYCFSDGEKLFVADGNMLIAQTPQAVITPYDATVLSVECTYDNTAFTYTTTHLTKEGSPQRRTALAKQTSPTEVTLRVLCNIDAFRAGDTIRLAGFGAADGQWLIGERQRSVFQPYSNLTLVQAMQPVNAQTGLPVSGVTYDTGALASRPGSGTVIAAMIAEATALNNDNYPYVWAGGHAVAGTPSVGSPGQGYDGHTVGFDCSGAVGAVLNAAGLLQPPGFSPPQVPGDAGIISGLQADGILQQGQGQVLPGPECTLFDQPGVHIYMRLNGRYWGTLAGTMPSNGSGVGWCDNGYPMAGFNAYHIPVSVLGQQFGAGG